MVKINEYPVKENEAAIVLDERKDGWKKLAQLRALLQDRYNFYIQTDGVGNIFVHLADNNCDEMGSERYKWVSAEEDEFLDCNREEEQKNEATAHDLNHWTKDAVASTYPYRDDLEYAQDESMCHWTINDDDMRWEDIAIENSIYKF